MWSVCGGWEKWKRRGSWKDGWKTKVRKTLIWGQHPVSEGQRGDNCDGRVGAAEHI